MSVEVLQAKIRKKKFPCALRMELTPDGIPPAVLQPAETQAAAYERFGCGILDAVCDKVPAVIFNTAWFEVLGADGLRAMQRLCAHARENGFYVIVETMRGDEEEAAALQAATYFGPLYNADAMVVSAFLGSDGVKPYLQYCRSQDKGLFILAKTPNKSSREVQDLLSGDRVVYSVMTDLAVRWSTDLITKCGYSKLGVVVGANHPTVLQTLRRQYDRLFFLCTGYGLPGAKDVRHAFDKFGHGAAAVVSKAILCAWQKDGGDHTQAAAAAVERLRRELSKDVAVI